MGVPDFQTIMRPLLAHYEDGQERSIGVVRDRLGAEFDLSATDLEERLPSGTAKTFANRVGWAATYLYRTRLLERPRRSVYRITDRGRSALEENSARIDLRVLRQYPELAAFRRPTAAEAAGVAEPLEEIATPEERIETAYAELREALSAELLDRILRQTPEFFEQLVLDVLVAMGYGGSRREAAARLGRSGDAGIDGVIQEDQLGLDVIYVQAKRWGDNPVGRPTVQAFVGALQGARASKGVLITSSTFSQEARDYAASVTPRVILIDGVRLAQLMVDHDVGATAIGRYVLKRVDEDYFGLEDGAVGS